MHSMFNNDLDNPLIVLKVLKGQEIKYTADFHIVSNFSDTYIPLFM